MFVYIMFIYIYIYSYMKSFYRDLIFLYFIESHLYDSCFFRFCSLWKLMVNLNKY